MNRREFTKHAAILSSGMLLKKASAFTGARYPTVRIREAQRKFKNKTIERAITEFSNNVNDPELGWLFGNCFPSTLDTTVNYQLQGDRPDTYVITGDIDAMWLRDSSAQVWPYLSFMKADRDLQQLVAGVINRQTVCILRDPYANAFYRDANKTGEWKNDVTDMKPGLHERKWEIDSLCYPIRLAHQYWELTGDTGPFDAKWKSGIELTLKTFKEQQRKNNQGPYSFQRKTAWATDGVPINGFGYPVKPNGLICSAFRPSDDATIYMYLVPSNFFAVVSLKQASAMVRKICKDEALSAELESLSIEVAAALSAHAVVEHSEFGKIYAYEVNGFGSYNLMDDANVPSLLSLPYLNAVSKEDPVYQNTRKMLLSENNPFFFKGLAGEGIGGPHAGRDMIWPIGIIIRALTSTNDAEIKECLGMLKRSHAGTGFMHESFNKNDAAIFTRKWFAWANTLYGELLWETYKTKPKLLA
jgi:meiotically up-regulated gene 157 (Mug157) protein